MKNRFWTALVIVLALGTAATLIFRQKNAEAAPLGYGIGSVVTNFSLKNVDGNMVSLANYQDKKGVIVIFTCNHCPFAKAYEDRIIGLDKKYEGQGMPVIAISANDASEYEEDSYENMKKRATEKAYPFPYLYDETQAIAKTFGAVRTPHVFVLRNEGGKFTVQYIGTIDDNYQDAGGVTKRYVEDAANSILAGKPVVVNQTKAIGCAISWKDA